MQTGLDGMFTKSWLLLWFAAVSYRTIGLLQLVIELLGWCGYRKVFDFMTTGSSLTLPWNMAGVVSHSQTLTDAQVLILKVISPCTSECGYVRLRLENMWSSKLFEANILVICQAIPKFMKTLSQESLEPYSMRCMLEHKHQACRAPQGELLLIICNSNYLCISRFSSL